MNEGHFYVDLLIYVVVGQLNHHLSGITPTNQPIICSTLETRLKRNDLKKCKEKIQVETPGCLFDTRVVLSRSSTIFTVFNTVVQQIYHFSFQQFAVLEILTIFTFIISSAQKILINKRKKNTHSPD